MAYEIPVFGRDIGGGTVPGRLPSAGLAPGDELLGALHGPVGLDIGSETPEEIALAIVAEIQAVLAGRPAGFLKDRRKPLHDWPA